MTTRSRVRTAPLRLALTCCAALLVPALAAAQPTAVQVQTDSTAAWAEQAKAGFRAQAVDSVTRANSAPFDKVGLIARALFRRFSHRDLVRARDIQPTLDSLGLSTEVAIDPQAPQFALVMVRNPSRLTSEAVGYLYWYREGDLRAQGAVFPGGYRPNMRIWWTARAQNPYEWGVVDETRGGVLHLTLLAMSNDGTSWGIEQSEKSEPLLSEPGAATWADVNGDGIPELVTWTRQHTDSLFTECADCPHLLTERLLTESPFGFEQTDQRLLPTPYATLVYFVRLLIDGKTSEAARLVREPAKVREAIAEGWNRRVVKNPWFVEQGESGQAWPRRLGVRFQGPAGVRRYDVVFAMKEGHWIIEDWFVPRAAGERTPSVRVPSKPATPPASRPATRRRAAPAPSKGK